MRHLKVKLAAVAACAIALGGCATAPTAITEPSTLREDVEDAIGKAAQRAAEAQETLARVQVSRSKPTPSPLRDADLPEELRRPATLEWSGPAHEAARRLAALVGYRFAVVGNPPSVPPVVHVSVRDVPVGKALEQVGLQAYPFGEVAVDPSSRRVEFRYLQAQQQQTVRGASPTFRGVSK